MSQAPLDHADLVAPYELAAMDRALELARRGPAHGPNPQVGCVLLDAEGRVLGEGWHAGAGSPHAEAAALHDATSRGLATVGATAVVTLEPCSHTGRTGPCAELLVGAGVRRVLFAVPDPNAEAAGGAQVLTRGGVEVTGGVLREVGEDLLRIWLRAVRGGRPYVTLKLATSLDGRVAARDGTSRWITSPESRADAHALRAQVDAIMVGSGTVLADDPALTARDTAGDLTDHQPLRVVMGRRPVPHDARLRGPGGELVHLATHDLRAALEALAGREVRHVLLEGGPTIATAALHAGVVDEVRAYVAPVLIGAGPHAVGDLGVTSIGQAHRLVTERVDRLGPDALVVLTPAAAGTARNPEEG